MDESQGPAMAMTWLGKPSVTVKLNQFCSCGQLKSSRQFHDMFTPYIFMGFLWPPSKASTLICVISGIPTQDAKRIQSSHVLRTPYWLVTPVDLWPHELPWIPAVCLVASLTEVGS